MDFLDKYNPKDLTFEKTWAMFQETDKKFKETDKKFQETDKKFKNTDKMLETLGNKIDKLFESTKRLDNFVNNVADTAEYFFYEAINGVLEKYNCLQINGFCFDEIKKNYFIGKKKKRKEVDILLIDSEKKVLAIIEVKTKLHRKYFEVVEKIKEYLAEDGLLVGYRYIYGFASFNIPQECEELAQELGVFLLKPTLNRTTIEREYLQKFEPKVF